MSKKNSKSETKKIKGFVVKGFFDDESESESDKKEVKKIK